MQAYEEEYRRLWHHPLDFMNDPDGTIWSRLCDLEERLLRAGKKLRDIRPAKS